jgi:hypothetical protein
LIVAAAHFMYCFTYCSYFIPATYSNHRSTPHTQDRCPACFEAPRTPACPPPPADGAS